MKGRRETDAELEARISRLRDELQEKKRELRAAERKRSDRMCGGRRRYVNPFSPVPSEQRKLIHDLVDVGYKALAKELHPDCGGTAADFARLGHVRDRLRSA